MWQTLDDIFFLLTVNKESVTQDSNESQIRVIRCCKSTCVLSLMYLHRKEPKPHGWNNTVGWTREKTLKGDKVVFMSGPIHFFSINSLKRWTVMRDRSR